MLLFTIHILERAERHDDRKIYYEKPAILMSFRVSYFLHAIKELYAFWIPKLTVTYSHTYHFLNFATFTASVLHQFLVIYGFHSNWQRQKLFLYAFIHWARKQKWQTFFVFLTDKLSFKSRHVIIKWSWKPLYIVFTACSVLKSSDNVNCFNILQSWSFMNHDDAEKTFSS